MSESKQVNADLLEALKELRLTAQLLQQNSEGCAVKHHGINIELDGLPGWLKDTKASIDRALAAIAKATNPAGHVKN